MHPRKIYFFLTTIPRQEIPADSSDIIDAADSVKGGKRVISPSISNASVDGDAEAAEERKREALSPSPEVDLSLHDIDPPSQDSNLEFIAPGTPAGSFSGRSSLARDGTNASHSEASLTHNHRAISPPLEGDEKEFTQTASNVRMRGMSLDNPTVRPSTEDFAGMTIEETEEDRMMKNREAAEALFWPHNQPSMGGILMSSPLVKPTQPNSLDATIKKEAQDVEMQEPVSILDDHHAGLTWDTREPDDVQIEELDDLFMAY